MKTLFVLIVVFCILTPVVATEVIAPIERLHQEALAKLQDGDYAGARESAEKALELYRGSQSRRDQERAAALVAIADLDTILSDLDSAEKRYTEALEILTKYFKREHPKVKAVAQKLGQVQDHAAPQ